MAGGVADLTKVFDEYLAAVKAKDFKRVVAVFQSSVKQQVLADFESDGQRKSFLESLAEMAPESYQSSGVSPSTNKKMLLRVVAKKNVPPEIQKEQKLPPSSKCRCSSNSRRRAVSGKWDRRASASPRLPRSRAGPRTSRWA